MRLVGARCWVAGGLLVSLCACDAFESAAFAQPAAPQPNITIVPPPPPPPPPPAPTRTPEPLCSGRLESEYGRLSNGWGNGSYYFSMLSRCSDKILLDIDFWAETDAQFVLKSDLCPGADLRWNSPGKETGTSEEAYVAHLESLLRHRLADFRGACGLEPPSGERLFEGFAETYAGEARASWIHNRYIDKLAARNRLGWPDEQLKVEAREEYAEAH